MNTEARYLAARCAALAGCGLGRDGAGLSRAERARWRQQARVRLRADPALWVKSLDGGSEPDLALGRRMLAHWQGDPDLAGVRARDALARLPDEERERWERLWSDVVSLLRRVSVPQ